MSENIRKPRTPSEIRRDLSSGSTEHFSHRVVTERSSSPCDPCQPVARTQTVHTSNPCDPCETRSHRESRVVCPPRREPEMVCEPRRAAPQTTTSSRQQVCRDVQSSSFVEERQEGPSTEQERIIYEPVAREKTVTRHVERITHTTEPVSQSEAAAKRTETKRSL
ncbi:hypothetical protein RCL1_004696 [Eukaryota sp. TZLM3-RCL]